MLTVLLLAVRPWRDAVMRATPLAALPALVLALAGPTGARLSLPGLVQHAVLELDLVGRVFLGFTSVLYLASGWYARGYLVKDANPVRFHLFFLLAMTGNFGLILAGDIPTFYTAFALMGLASAGLVFHRGDAEATRAGRIYLALAMVGEVLILSGFVFLTVAGGTTQIAELHRGVFSLPALLLLLAGFGIKAGALSLHFWLPLAHPAAPVPASAVLSGAMIKAGLLGWIRFLPLGEATMPGCGFTLDQRRTGRGLSGNVCWRGAEKSESRAGLFEHQPDGHHHDGPGHWCAAARGVAGDSGGRADLRDASRAGERIALSGRWPGARGAHPVAAPRGGRGSAAARAGLGGRAVHQRCAGQDRAEGQRCLSSGGWATALGLLLPLAAAGTTLKMARFLWLTWPRPGHATESSARGLWLPWLGLVVAMLAGVWLLPGALEVLPKKLSAEKLWDALWPLLVGGALAVLGAGLRRWFSADPDRWLPAGDIGVFLEKLLARVGLLLPASAGSHEAHDHEGRPDETDSRWTAALATAGARLAAAESSLRSWTVAGALLLLLIGLILFLLAVSRT